MKKSLYFYVRKGWEEDFSKGDGWRYGTEFPNLYINKENIKNNNHGDWKEIKANFNKYFVRVRITIES